MKKVFCLIIFIFCMLLICGCDGNSNLVLNNMSDMRINFFEGNNNNIYVNLSCGYREEVFLYDGVSSTPVECGVLSLGFYEHCSYSSIAVILEVNGEETEYVLEKSPYEDLYLEDIGKILNSNNKIFIKLKNQEEKIELTEISVGWQVNYKEAVKIGADHFKEQINSLYFNGTFNAECYLKIVSKYGFENKYWYFSIIDKTGETNSCLIDVNTGEIVTK